MLYSVKVLLFLTSLSFPSLINEVGRVVAGSDEEELEVELQQLQEEADLEKVTALPPVPAAALPEKTLEQEQNDLEARLAALRIGTSPMKKKERPTQVPA